MKISTRGRYALQALTTLAASTGDEPRRLRDLAQEAGVPEGYLEQLFLQLKGAGLLSGQPGAGGGYRLARPAEAITAGDVLRAVESSFRLLDCLEDGCARQDACVSRLLWQGLQQEIDRVADGVTLQALAARCQAQGEEPPDYAI